MRLLEPGRRRVALLVGGVILAVAVPATVWLLSSPGRPTVAGTDSRAAERAGRAARTDRTCAGQPLDAPRELRGMWLTTVNNMDWPSKPGLDQETIKAEFRSWLDLAQRLNHNAIFVHVRPSGDALWPSRYAPWSEWLTGKRDGQSPGWDPLQFMVAETHKRNLEFHAWFNPYRASQPAPAGAGPDLNQLAPDHPLRLRPEWAVVYPVNAPGSRLYYNPGIPEARTFVEDSMLEAVQRYDIDGVHFDDFFYPYPAAGQDFRDDLAFTQFGAGFANKADWRRDNVNHLVQEMSVRIKQLKPWVKFGISPFGIWRNDRTDPTGSPTRGLQSYDEIFADTRLWVKREWLDYIVPQVYWNIGFAVADYAKLVPWWSQVVSGTRVQLYIGQADYRVGQPGAWQDPGELDRQLTLNRQYLVSGSVHFSAKNLRDDKLGSVTRYRDAHDAGPALVPAMTRLPGNPPPPPIIEAVRPAPGGSFTLTWRGSNATSYAIYKVGNAAEPSGTRPNGASAGSGAVAAEPPGTRPNGASAGSGAAARLVGTTRDLTWTDRSTGPATYCVTALDRSWNESGPSAPVTHSP
jgi:uncharacterized lipoprotein YddW (UPF0748 family)